MQVVTTRLSADLVKALVEIEGEEQADRAEVVRRLLARSVREWRLQRAVKLVAAGQWTVRRGARYVGMSYLEFLNRLAEVGADTGPRLTDLPRLGRL